MSGLRHTACAVLISLGVLFVGCSEAWSQKVLVLQSRDIEPFRQAVEGLKSVLESSHIETIVQTHGSAKSGESQTLAETAASLGVSVLVTVGTVATDDVLAQHIDVPLVFCMVLDPVGRGFVDSLDEPGGAVTGIALDIPLEAQFKALEEVLPEARRIGVLYSTPRNKELVREAEVVADRLGLQLVPAEIASEQAVPSVLRNLTDEIDALWGIADPVAFSNVSTEHLILHTIRNRIPFMGLSASFVKAGALLALSCDYHDVGRQTGETVLEVLKGRLPGDIPVSFPRATALHLSMRTARLIGVEIPPEVVEKAKEVRL